MLRKELRRSTAFVLAGLVVASLATLVVTTATASTKSTKASVQVCVLLPDTKSSVRWVQFDAPDLKKAFAKAGVTASINNALNDPLKQKAQAQACLAAGATVVIETALDNGSASSIEKLFTSKGGKAIDYDRQVTGGERHRLRHVQRLGEAQAKGVVAAMKACRHLLRGGSTSLSCGAGRPTRTRSGSRAATTPSSTRCSRAGRSRRGRRSSCPTGTRTTLRPSSNQMLVQTNDNIQGVLAANDNIAGAVVADLKAKHLKPVALSGQDTTAQGIQYILAGWQSGTVYKFVPDEANAAAAAAVALIHGKKPVTNGFRKNGSKNEPTLALPVKWITKSNYKQLFAQGWLKRSDVCIGVYKQYCK